MMKGKRKQLSESMVIRYIKVQSNMCVKFGNI